MTPPEEYLYKEIQRYINAERQAQIHLDHLATELERLQQEYEYASYNYVEIYKRRMELTRLYNAY